MLSLDDCKWLAEAGLPQDKEGWHWLLIDEADGFKLTYFFGMEAKRGVAFECYRIPDLEDLMEFARTKISGKWALHPGQTYMVVGVMGDYEDEDPKQAIIQMCKYYFREKVKQ